MRQATPTRRIALLVETSPDRLVVVGIAWGIGASVAIGDLIVPECVGDLESGERFVPAPLGDAAPRGTPWWRRWPPRSRQLRIACR